MTQEAPEFHTQPSTPLSPLPLHPPVPSNIPVLGKQNDPFFNMNTVHESNHDPSNSQPTIATSETLVIPDDNAVEDSPASDSSFSDAYKEETVVMEGSKGPLVKEDSSAEIDEEYAMTFDSEEDEGQSENHDVSESQLAQDTASLPISVPTAELPFPPIVYDPSIADVFLNGPDSKPTQTSPSSAYLTSAAAPPSDQTSIQIPIQTAQAPSHTYEDIASGGIDIQQLLDNITANAENNSAVVALAPTPSVTSSHPPLPYGGTSLTSHASLPPRPQISSYRPPGVPTPLVAAGAPGTSSDPRTGLPPPPTASFRSPPALSAPTQISSIPHIPVQRAASQDFPTQSIESPIERDDPDKRWGPNVQKIYDEFLAEERGYVAEGLWDRFPNGSRLFIGNLPSEKVTKRDLFHVFHKYGRLAQVSIKQAYGFVQFHDTTSCYAALNHEQGTEVRGKKIHLEISKPQRNTRNAQKPAPAPVRRSRSPDYQRGMADRGSRSATSGGRGTDQYDNRAVQPARDEYGRNLRTRDDYRPGRSPSPPRGNYRNREDYSSTRSREYHDGRRRSRSNSPYGHRDNGRYRDRSPSPGARQAIEDADLQIPRRDPRDVPDVQIILLDELDRGFVGWVDGELRGRGIKSEIMFLSPRLPIQAVIRRQILEGVHAVSQLDMRSQNSSKIPLQVFDRQAGINNVRFDEYQDLEPKIAAELILREKQKQAQASTYMQPQYLSGQSYQPPPVPAPAVPDLANLVGQLDNATLQRLLSALPQQQQSAPAVAASSGLDLAGLLGGLNPQPPQQVYQPPAPPANLYNSGATSFTPQAQPQSAQQVQNIMAQLAKFRQ